MEDAPGTGKTALARAIAATCAGRIPAHPVHARPAALRHHGRDHLRPAHELVGLHKGPHLRLDRPGRRINRASPKTQSALLEVMEEAQVTVDGVRGTGRPFMVIATQEPRRAGRGTYPARGSAGPLPHEDVDRLPGPEAGIDVILGSAAPTARALDPVISRRLSPTWRIWRPTTTSTVRSPPTRQDLCEAGRADSEVVSASTRGAIAMMRAARVWAIAQGRNFVIPDDVQALAVRVWAHRLVLDPTPSSAEPTREASSSVRWEQSPPRS